MINKRIEILLQKEGLTSSSFADKVGVQRSGISHILSGRNKPSLDLLQKILKAFPAIEAQWLVTGEGDMYNTTDSPSGGLFSAQNTNTQSQDAPKEPPKTPRDEDTSTQAPTDQVKDGIDPPVYGHKMPISKHPLASGQQDIERIVIFYTDGSFSAHKQRQ